MTVKQNKYYPRQLTFGRESSVVDVVFMYNSPEEFHKTSVHTVWSKTQSGKTFPRSVECHKQHTFGDIRGTTACPLCDADRHIRENSGATYYPNASRSYAWVIDTSETAQPGSRLMWMEIPYSLEQAISNQMLMQPGVPLYQLSFKLFKQVEAQSNGRNKTTYTAGIVGNPLDPYDPLLFAREHGMQGFPSLVGARGASPIESVTDPTELGNIQAQMVTNYNEFAAKQGYQQVPMMQTQTIQQQQPTQQFQQPVGAPAGAPAGVNQGYAVNQGNTVNQGNAAPTFNTPPAGKNQFQQPASQPQFTPQTAEPVTQPVTQPDTQPVTQPAAQPALQGQNPFPNQGQVFSQEEPAVQEDEMPKLDITSDKLPF